MLYTGAVVLLLAFKSIQPISAICDIDINELPTKQPLYLINAKNVLFPSTHNGRMQLKAGEKIELFCAGSFDNPKGISDSQVLTCDTGNSFKIDVTNTAYNITKITCSSIINAVFKAGPISGMYEIGFNVTNRFIKQMDIVFDDSAKMIRYVKHTILPGCFSTTNNNVPMTFTAKGNPYGTTTADMNRAYSDKSQKDMIMNLLGVPSNKYIEKPNKFLARGHLAARADFVYINEQRASYSYMNVAPQWQTFNAGNWRKIERSLRKYLTDRTLDRLEIYTGVHDSSTLPNADGVSTRLYLEYANIKLAVPKYFYKIVINPSTSQGVVIIGVNNLYLNRAQIRDYIICTDISNQVPWLSWNTVDVKYGYMYACEVSEFIRRNPTIHLPALNVRTLLI